jgi:hypothetical protein
MKKRWWVLIVMFVLAGTSYGAYKYYFDRNVTASEVHVEDDFFDFSEVALSVQRHSQVEPEVTHQARSSNQPAEPALPNTNASTGSRNSNANVTDSPGAITNLTEEAIKAKYYPAFEKLRNIANARLDQLAANAKKEYQKSKKEGNPPLSDIIARYSSAAKKLQSKVDETFYSLLGQMKHDLQVASLPLDLVEIAEDTYQNAKRQKRVELMEKMSKN